MYGCKHDGCTKHVRNGDAIHRTSPKGGPFEGVCTEHAPLYGVTAEPIAVAIEDRNKGKL